MSYPGPHRLQGRSGTGWGSATRWMHEKDNAEQPQDDCGRDKETERRCPGHGKEGPEGEGSKGRDDLLQSSDQMRPEGPD